MLESARNKARRDRRRGQEEINQQQNWEQPAGFSNHLEEKKERQNLPGASEGERVQFCPGRHATQALQGVKPCCSYGLSLAFTLDFLIVIGLSKIIKYGRFLFCFYIPEIFSSYPQTSAIFSCSASWLMIATAVLCRVNLFSALSLPSTKNASGSLF